MVERNEKEKSKSDFQKFKKEQVNRLKWIQTEKILPIVRNDL